MLWYWKSVGWRGIVEFVLLTVFAIFFAGPLVNLLVLAFSEKWNYPAVLPSLPSCFALCWGRSIFAPWLRKRM